MSVRILVVGDLERYGVKFTLEAVPQTHIFEGKAQLGYGVWKHTPDHTGCGEKQELVKVIKRSLDALHHMNTLENMFRQGMFSND